MFRPPVFPAAVLGGEFQLTRGLDPAAMRPRTDGNGRPKLDAEGRPSFSVSAEYWDDSGMDRSVRLAVVNPPKTALPPRTTVRATGSVRAVPWVRDGRQMWTMIADGIEPAAASSSVDPETGEVLSA